MVVCQCRLKKAAEQVQITPSAPTFALPVRHKLPMGWNHLMFHVATFAEQHLPVELRKYIRYESAKQALENAGLSTLASMITSFTITQILPGITGDTDHQVDIFKINQVRHASSSKIFNEDGKFDHSLFEALMIGYSNEYKGERVLTEGAFKEIHQEFKARDKPTSGCFHAELGNAASIGEFNALFDVLADEKAHIGGKEQRFIREDIFKSFYKDGPFVYDVAGYYQKINKAQTINKIFKEAKAIKQV